MALFYQLHTKLLWYVDLLLISSVQLWNGSEILLKRSQIRYFFMVDPLIQGQKRDTKTSRYPESITSIAQ